MNNVVLLGRLVRDPDLKDAGQTKIARFTVAVTRSYRNASGEYESDFISCVAWRSTAEFIARYFQKGSRILLNGNITTGSYEKNGQKVYTTEVTVSSAEIIDAKTAVRNTVTANYDAEVPETEYENDDSDLPF